MQEFYVFLGMVVAPGSIGALTAGAVSWFISKKYEAKLAKDIEAHKSELTKDVEALKSNLAKDIEALKSKLGNHTYTSKVKFDLEVEIYRALFDSFFEAVSLLSNAFVNYQQGETDEFQESGQLSMTSKEVDRANKTLRMNAPFIPEDVYNNFDELYFLCIKQLSTIIRCYKDLLNAEEKDQCEERAHDIAHKMDALMKNMRKHVAEMEIL